jgi:hypothetical protein
LPFGEETRYVALRIDADRIARNDHNLVCDGVSDLLDNPLQRGESERQNDGLSAPRGVEIVGCDDRGPT